MSGSFASRPRVLDLEFARFVNHLVLGRHPKQSRIRFRAFNIPQMHRGLAHARVGILEKHLYFLDRAKTKTRTRSPRARRGRSPVVAKLDIAVGAEYASLFPLSFLVVFSHVFSAGIFGTPMSDSLDCLWVTNAVTASRLYPSDPLSPSGLRTFDRSPDAAQPFSS